METGKNRSCSAFSYGKGNVTAISDAILSLMKFLWSILSFMYVVGSGGSCHNKQNCNTWLIGRQCELILIVECRMFLCYYIFILTFPLVFGFFDFLFSFLSAFASLLRVASWKACSVIYLVPNVNLYDTVTTRWCWLSKSNEEGRRQTPLIS